MAREATILVQRSQPINITCSNAAAIEKGTYLKIADPFTASASTATNDIVGGFCFAEKIANEGTKIAVLRGPGDILKVTASGSIAIGDPLVFAAPGNYVMSAINTAGLSGSVIVGTALETATADETFKMELNIQVGSGV